MFDILQISNIIVQQDIFYGYILLQMNKICDNDFKSLAGVRSNNNGQIDLIYNEKLLSKLTLNQQLAVIQHQIKHIAHGHIHFLQRLYDANKLLSNIAMDMAINCTIDDLPKKCLYPSLYGFPNNQTCQFYYQKLLTKTQAYIKDILAKQDITVNDHEQLNNIPESICGEIVQQSLQAATLAGYNTAGLEKILGWMKKKGKLKWNKILKSNISKLTIPSDNIQSTKNKTSRRFGSIPGFKKTYQYNNILVLLDTSGSMSSSVISNILTQIYNMSHLVKTIEVVQFDVSLKPPIKWNNKIQFNLIGRGGTHFTDQMINEINKKYKNWIKIVMTDGQINNIQNMFTNIVGQLI